MILNEREIKEELEAWNIIIHDWEKRVYNPVTLKDQSIDVRVWEFLFVPKRNKWFNTKDGIKIYWRYNIWAWLTRKLRVWEFCLLHTQEFIGTKGWSWNLPTLKLKSSAWRLGIMHTLAGHGEVWFHNRRAMEVMFMLPITIKQSMSIAQIYFTRVKKDVEDDYTKKGTYQSTSDIDELVKNWKREDILPPESLKIIKQI